jgi:hypothetical protein
MFISSNYHWHRTWYREQAREDDHQLTKLPTEFSGLLASLIFFFSNIVSYIMASKRGSKLFLRIGIPLFGFIVGGTFVLSTFLETSIELKDKRNGTGTASISQRKFDLEEEHRKMMQNLDIDNYKLSKIPRPDDSEKKKEDDNVIRKTLPAHVIDLDDENDY